MPVRIVPSTSIRTIASSTPSASPSKWGRRDRGRGTLVVAKTIKQTGMLGENEVIAGTVRPFQYQRLAQSHAARHSHGLARENPAALYASRRKVAEIRTIFDSMEVPVG
jgi:hypothetical protein